jgi:branched-chain amino acid transport system substrate-binding protein
VRTKRKLCSHLLWIGAASALLIAGCSSGNTSASSSASSSGIPSGPIHIAATFPLSGTEAALGSDYRANVDAAIQKINSQGGILGHKLVASITDTAGSTTQMVVAAKTALSQHPACYLTDQFPDVLSASPTINQYEVPSFAADPAGPDQLNVQKNPWLFSVNGSDQSYAALLAGYLGNTLHVSKVGAIVEIDAFPDQVSLLSNYLASQHIASAGSQTFNGGATDVTAQLQRLRNAGATGLVVDTFGPGLNAVVRGLQALKWNVPAVGPAGVSAATATDAIAQANMHNFFGSQVSSAFLLSSPTSKPSPAVQAYLKAYLANGGNPGDEVTSNYLYDEVLLCGDAIRQAHSTQPQAIVKALESGTVFGGIRTDYKFSATNHQGDLASGLGFFEVWESCATTCIAAPVQPAQ